MFCNFLHEDLEQTPAISIEKYMILNVFYTIIRTI